MADLAGEMAEEEEIGRMGDKGITFDANLERDGGGSEGEDVEISYRSTMEAALLGPHDEREHGMARLRSISQDHRQVVMQQHTDTGSDNLGFETTIEVSGDGNLGLREVVGERRDSIVAKLAFKRYPIVDRVFMHRLEGEGMISKIGERERGGQGRMERQAVYGVLTAAAVAVNVALQSLSGAGSIALSPTSDSCLGNRRFRKRRRKNEEETDFIPAVVSTFADAEVLASFSFADPPPKKDLFLFDDFDWFIKPRSRRWWRKLFRVSKPTFDYICQLVKPDIESDTPASFQGIEGRVITVEKQVAIALRRLASGDSLTTLGEFFGVGESTVSKVIWKFVNSMEKRARHHMKWPEGEEMERVKAGFEADHGLPNCCGVIDLTHILMELPGTDSSVDWFDREQNYSMLMQVVVDMDMKVRDLFTGWPGSITDSRLLRNSGFYAVCESRERLNGPSRTVNGIEVREHILGDSGYPLLPWLVNPYSATGSSPTKDAFNSKHASTKCVVDDALGRLKGAWKILHKVLWRPDIRKLPKIILVCCLLHNILIEAGEEMEDGVALVGHHDEGYRQQWCLSVEPEGHVIREALAEHTFANHP